MGSVKSVMKLQLSSGVTAGILVAAVLIIAGTMFWRVMGPADSGEGDPQMGMAGGEGMEMGMGGGMGMDPAMMGQPDARNDLRVLVQRLTALQKKNSSALTAEQCAKLLPILTALPKSEALDSAAAASAKTAIEACLTATQKSNLQTIAVPGGDGAGPGMQGSGQKMDSASTGVAVAELVTALKAAGAARGSTLE